MAVLRSARERDWEQVREVRLAALAQAPEVFASTLEREAAFDSRRWRSWVEEAAVFLALDDGAAIGMAAGVREKHPQERKLVALWVAPRYRRTGAAAELVDEVIGWARADAAHLLGLWVTPDNHSARKLYSRHGFVDSGERMPLPSNPAVVVERMTRSLTAEG